MVSPISIPTGVTAVEIGIVVEEIGYLESSRRSRRRQSQRAGVLAKAVLDEIGENLLVEWMDSRFTLDTDAWVEESERDSKTKERIKAGQKIIREMRLGVSDPFTKSS